MRGARILNESVLLRLSGALLLQLRASHCQGLGAAGGGGARRRLGACSIPQIQEDLAGVHEVCCVPASNCASGAPAACSAECAHVFLDFYQRCYSDLGPESGLEELSVFTELVDKCHLTTPSVAAAACLDASQEARLKQDLGCLADPAGTAARRRICAARARTVLGLQPEEEERPVAQCDPNVALFLPRSAGGWRRQRRLRQRPQR